MNIEFNPTVATDLCEIMGRNKSDKGHTNIQDSWHNYTTVYYSLFKDLRNTPLRIFELGLGTNNTSVPSNMGPNGRPGASVYGWSEFFPSASVFGADIDRGILFNTDRIKTYYCDQTNPDVIRALWANEDLSENFDIIIDDGLHAHYANVCFFENSIHKLKAGGYYIIEDIINNTTYMFENSIRQWMSAYPSLQFKLIRIPSTKNNIDNTLLVIKKQE
jgi:hypothetical protein